MPYGTDGVRERETSLHIQDRAVKEGDTKLIFQKRVQFAIIKERYTSYAVKFGNIFLYLTHIIMRKFKAFGMMKDLPACG